jgi:hypothetical protein
MGADRPAMGVDDRHAPVELARRRAELTVQDLWLRYVAMGGACDALDIDGYLQGLFALETFQQDVLAQAVNERLADIYTSARVPLSPPSPDEGTEAEELRRVVERILGGPAPDANGGSRSATGDQC